MWWNKRDTIQPKPEPPKYSPARIRVHLKSGADVFTSGTTIKYPDSGQLIIADGDNANAVFNSEIWDYAENVPWPKVEQPAPSNPAEGAK